MDTLMNDYSMIIEPCLHEDEVMVRAVVFAYNEDYGHRQVHDIIQGTLDEILQVLYEKHAHIVDEIALNDITRFPFDQLRKMLEAEMATPAYILKLNNLQPDQ